MANAWEIPSEHDRRAFVAKLCQFRGQLSPSEQRMLDSLLMTASGGRGDVQAYGLGDSAERLTAMLLGLLAELGQHHLAVDADGTPRNLLPYSG
jgi:hypothetical protein